jgi:hypothetical protein
VNDLVVESRPMSVEMRLSEGPVSIRMRRMAGRWLATATGPRGEV